MCKMLRGNPINIFYLITGAVYLRFMPFNLLLTDTPLTIEMEVGEGEGDSKNKSERVSLIISTFF